jgi:gamma-F420-2:alpha-L-glutamate ligase
MSQIVSVDFHTSSSSEKGKLDIALPSEYLNYNLKPILRSESKILFYNATDLSFYERKLLSPKAHVWLLRRNLEYNYSMRRLCEQAYEMNIQLYNIKIQDFEVVIGKDGLEELLYLGNKFSKSDLPDSILPRFGSNIDPWSMAVLRQIEFLGGRLINSVSSLEFSKDKLLTYQKLASEKLPIPKTLLGVVPINYQVLKTTFESYPIILKYCSGGQGRGVTMIHSEDYLEDFIDMMDKTHPFVFQEFIKNSSGRDIRVIVVGGKVVSSMMRVATKGFKSNFHQGGTVRSVEIGEEVEALCVASTKALGLEIAGVDLLIGANGYIICEINSSPGFEGFELATGVNTAEQMLIYATSIGNNQ